MSTPENQNSNERESAAQMLVDKITTDSKAIRTAMKADAKGEYPSWSDEEINAYVLGNMSYLLQQIANGTKSERDYVRQQVKELIKYGKGK